MSFAKQSKLGTFLKFHIIFIFTLLRLCTNFLSFHSVHFSSWFWKLKFMFFCYLIARQNPRILLIGRYYWFNFDLDKKWVQLMSTMLIIIIQKNCFLASFIFMVFQLIYKIKIIKDSFNFDQKYNMLYSIKDSTE